MTVLGLDTTGQPVSAAVMQNGIITGSLYLNIGKKHAETLMPVIDEILGLVDADVSEIDAVAVAAGPGSFTGIRIGAACAEGLARGLNVPVYTVNALDALLMNIHYAEVKCSLMDARRGEVYVKAVCGDKILIKPQAIGLYEVLEMLSPFKPAVFNGDGALAYSEVIKEKMPDAVIARGQFCLQNAESVCRLFAQGMAKEAKDGVIIPEYLRLSQAERLKKENTEAASNAKYEG